MYSQACNGLAAKWKVLLYSSELSLSKNLTTNIVTILDFWRQIHSFEKKKADFKGQQNFPL